MSLCPVYKHSLTSPDYQKIDQLVQSYCGYIKSLGIPPQSKLPFIATNSLETVCFFFAAWRMQMIACPLSFRLPPLALEAALKRLDAPLITPQKGPPMKFVELDETLLATMLFTSGTTGQPKIACHRLSHHLTSAKEAMNALNLEPTDHYLASLPFFHVGGIGLLLRTFIAGATLILSENYSDPRISHLSLVPTQLYRILQDPPPLFNPKCILLGGAPIPKDLCRQSPNINTTYGMTETSSMITLNGKILPHLELKIGADQEILVRGKSVFAGYLQPDRTISSPLIEGWLHTKDRGIIREGKLEWIGRKDRMFISGGENIQPEEIEGAILALFKGIKVKVVPYEDVEFGMRPAAYIFTKDRSITLELLQNKLREVLPGYKIPQKLFYNGLDKTPALDKEKVLTAGTFI